MFQSHLCIFFNFVLCVCERVCVCVCLRLCGRFTWYQYQLVVHNQVGSSSGEEVTEVTQAGVPLRPPTLSAWPLNHTHVLVNWTEPCKNQHHRTQSCTWHWRHVDGGRSEGGKEGGIQV